MGLAPAGSFHGVAPAPCALYPARRAATTSTAAPAAGSLVRLCRSVLPTHAHPSLGLRPAHAHAPWCVRDSSLSPMARPRHAALPASPPQSRPHGAAAASDSSPRAPTCRPTSARRRLGLRPLARPGLAARPAPTTAAGSALLPPAPRFCSPHSLPLLTFGFYDLLNLRLLMLFDLSFDVKWLMHPEPPPPTSTVVAALYRFPT